MKPRKLIQHLTYLLNLSIIFWLVAQTYVTVIPYLNSFIKRFFNWKATLGMQWISKLSWLVNLQEQYFYVGNLRNLVVLGNFPLSMLSPCTLPPQSNLTKRCRTNTCLCSLLFLRKMFERLQLTQDISVTL